MTFLREQPSSRRSGKRHFLIYRIEGDLVAGGRVLHDAMELAQHVDSGVSWR